jgi:hypothetical protein
VAASTAVATIAAEASVAAATVVAASVAVIVVAAVPVGVGNHLKVVTISQRLYRSHVSDRGEGWLQASEFIREKKSIFSLISSPQIYLWGKSKI